MWKGRTVFKGYITHGSYFVYKGIKYGFPTTVLFTDAFYKRVGETHLGGEHYGSWHYLNEPMYKAFTSIKMIDGKETWNFSSNINYPEFPDCHYTDIVPERDIREIIYPVYYMKPSELVKTRFRNGTWFNYVWKQTLIYVLCLLISPVFKQWYLIWTIGLYLYLRLCYIELAKEEFIR